MKSLLFAIAAASVSIVGSPAFAAVNSNSAAEHIVENSSSVKTGTVFRIDNAENKRSHRGAVYGKKFGTYKGKHFSRSSRKHHSKRSFYKAKKFYNFKHHSRHYDDHAVKHHGHDRHHDHDHHHDSHPDRHHGGHEIAKKYKKYRD